MIERIKRWIGSLLTRKLRVWSPRRAGAQLPPYGCPCGWLKPDPYCRQCHGSGWALGKTDKETRARLESVRQSCRQHDIIGVRCGVCSGCRRWALSGRRRCES